MEPNDCHWIRRADNSLSLMHGKQVVARVMPEPGMPDRAMWIAGGSMAKQPNVQAYASAGWHEFDLWPGMAWESACVRASMELFGGSFVVGSMAIPEAKV